MTRQLYVNYAAILAATARIPVEQVINDDQQIDTALLRQAFEGRMLNLDECGDLEWYEAVELTDPFIEDEDGNPVSDHDINELAL